MTSLVCGQRPWCRVVYEDTIKHLPGTWIYVENPQALRIRLGQGEPRYVFVLHWSGRIPKDIVEAYELVGFHMTNLPFGRGGSPLQNLIRFKNQRTTLTAFRMTDELDAGPVYAKEDLSIDGGAEEVYLRAMRLAARIIQEHFVDREPPVPIPQALHLPEPWKRRRPEDSDLSRATCGGLADLHDAIRQVDATGYPRAYLDLGPFRLEFSRSALYSDHVKADVMIRMLGNATP